MSNDQRKHAHVFIRAVIYALLPMFLIYLVLVDLNPSGHRTFHYSLEKPSAMISALFPAQRLKHIDNGMQEVLLQPVYFRVRYPHRYDNAILQVKTQGRAVSEWRIGIEVMGNNEWSYYTVEPNSAGEAVFDLSQARVTGDTLRFIITATESAGEPFVIDDIRVMLERESLWQTMQRRSITI